MFENDALYLGLPSESHQESDREPGCLQVMQQLRLVIGFERVGNLDFYDDDIIDNKVGLELYNASAPKRHRKMSLLDGMHAEVLQSRRKRLHIDELRKTGTEFVIRIVEPPNDLSAYPGAASVSASHLTCFGS